VNHALPVLTFHDIVRERTRCRGDYAEPLMRHCLRTLHRRGFTTVDLCAGVAALMAGERLPVNAFAIAFDDGYASTLEMGFPVLESLGFKATLFVTTGEPQQETLPTSNGRRMLGWSDLRTLHAAGWGIGSHGVTHRDLRGLGSDELEHELAASRRTIEQRVGATVQSIAYPYGHHDEAVHAAARRHYRYGFATTRALTDGAGDPLALARIDMAYFNRRALVPLLATPLLGPYLRLPRPWAGRGAHSAAA